MPFSFGKLTDAFRLQRYYQRAGAIPAQSFTAGPATLALVIPTPTLVAGPVSFTAGPATIPAVVPTPGLAAGSVAFVAGPATLSIAVPTPSLTPGPAAFTAGPVTLALVFPTPTFATGGVAFTAGPVAIVSVVPTPSLLVGGVHLDPDPVVLEVVVPTPSLSGIPPQSIDPDPVVLEIVVPTPTLTNVAPPGPQFLAPLPVVLTKVVLTPTLTNVVPPVPPVPPVPVASTSHTLWVPPPVSRLLSRVNEAIQRARMRRRKLEVRPVTLTRGEAPVPVVFWEPKPEPIVRMPEAVLHQVVVLPAYLLPGPVVLEVEPVEINRSEYLAMALAGISPQPDWPDEAIALWMLG